MAGDLSKFDALNARKRVPWEERLALINQEFPSTVKLDWVRAFDDLDLMGRILRDYYKHEQAENLPGRSGPRPALDREKALAQHRQLMGTDFTELEFPEALRALSGGKSIREIEAKTGLNRNLVQKLLARSKEPDLYTIEQVAKAFNKKPEFFLEYRIIYILGAIGERMNMSPEMSVDLYKRFTRGRY